MTTSFDDVPACEAARSLDAWRVVDVRELEEFHGDLGHLPGATLLPLAKLGEAAAWPRSEPLLLVCRSGRRSREACQRLAAAGFTAVSNLSGGVVAWAERGLPLCGRSHGAHRCQEEPETQALEAVC
jgi:rhodanese-related sulfurtransferase